MRKPCCDKNDTKKGAWSKQEDQKLIDYVQKHGEGSWPSLPKAAGLLRCGKSCRLRWINYLRPDLKQGDFGEDEEDLIIRLHALLGNRWSLIAGRLPGRTDNEVKNYWNSHLRKKLARKGIDPNHHKAFRSIRYPALMISAGAAATLASNSNNIKDERDHNPEMDLFNNLNDIVDDSDQENAVDSNGSGQSKPNNRSTTTTNSSSDPEISLDLMLSIIPSHPKP